MIENTMKIYTCEFCGRYYKTKYCSIHEKYCRLNPKNKHRCFDICKHLEIDNEDGMKHFWCSKKELFLYSYKAEKIKHQDLENCTRMPLECDEFSFTD